MKRFSALILAVSLLLSGCGILGERIKEPVTFYYLNAQYQYGSNAVVIVSEEREASGHLDDLSYLMALYLMGPTEEEHEMPIPRGTRILNVEQKGSKIYLKLSDLSETMSDSEFSLACACLTLTCLGLSDAAQVIITSGNRTTTMTHDSLTMLDAGTSAAQTEETQ